MEMSVYSYGIYSTSKYRGGFFLEFCKNIPTLLDYNKLRKLPVEQNLPYQTPQFIKFVFSALTSSQKEAHPPSLKIQSNAPNFTPDPFRPPSAVYLPPNLPQTSRSLTLRPFVVSNLQLSSQLVDLE